MDHLFKIENEQIFIFRLEIAYPFQDKGIPFKNYKVYHLFEKQIFFLKKR